MYANTLMHKGKQGTWTIDNERELLEAEELLYTKLEMNFSINQFQKLARNAGKNKDVALTEKHSHGDNT